MMMSENKGEIKPETFCKGKNQWRGCDTQTDDVAHLRRHEPQCGSIAARWRHSWADISALTAAGATATSVVGTHPSQETKQQQKVKEEAPFMEFVSRKPGLLVSTLHLINGLRYHIRGIRGASTKRSISMTTLNLLLDNNRLSQVLGPARVLRAQLHDPLAHARDVLCALAQGSQQCLDVGRVVRAVFVGGALGLRARGEELARRGGGRRGGGGFAMLRGQRLSRGRG